jgi:hypothetical protein
VTTEHDRVRQEDFPQRPLPLRQRQEFQELLHRQGHRLGGPTGRPETACTRSCPQDRTDFPLGIALTPFGVVDARLKEIARATPGPAEWKGLVERLSEATPFVERMSAYRAVCGAGVLPDDAASFLFAHAVQRMPPDEPLDLEEEEDENAASEALDQHTLSMLRRHGVDDLADLLAANQLEYDRRYERGRQFFFGPPDVCGRRGESNERQPVERRTSHPRRCRAVPPARVDCLLYLRRYRTPSGNGMGRGGEG